MEQRYMEVLLEDIRGKFDLVLEGHEALRSEIQALDRKMEERFDLVDVKFDALSHRINTVEQRLDAKINSVEQNLSLRIDAIATDLSAHRRDTEVHSGYRVGE